MDKVDQLIKRAYDLYCEKKDEDIDIQALETLNRLHDAIDNWDESNDDLRRILFYKNFLVGPDMNAIAARGAAAAIQDEFITVMKKRSSATKISELFKIRKEGPLKDGKVNRIAEIQLIPHIVDYPTLKGNRPLLYIHRFVLSVFIEIMTTIANDGQLRDTASLLGIKPKGIPFEKLQVQIRTIVDESLARQNLGHELTKFTRATIAYHIVEANELL
jgi:hypothetical protein